MISLIKNSHSIYWIYGLYGLQAGIVAKDANTLDYSVGSTIIRYNEKILIYNVTGIPPKHIVMLDQVHGNDIIEIDTFPHENKPFIAKADGMVTTLPNICLVIRTADCVPVIIYDSKNKIVAALHSGWRGCDLNITNEAITMMFKKGSKPEFLYTLVLPSIGPQSYEVGPDVAHKFSNYIIKKEGKSFLNMWEHIKDTAIRHGIPPKNIFISNICTYLHNDEFFSHRKGDKGRNLNFVFLC